MAGDEDVDVGEKLTAPPDFDGPTSNRRCTDVLCTVLLWAMWISMTGLGIYGAQNGDYRLLVYPLDYAGNVCGTAAGPLDMTEYPYLYYVNDFSAGVCVKECPRLESLADPYTLVTYDGLYQADGATVSADDIDIADYSASNNTLACTADLCYPDGDPESSFTSRGVNEGKGFAYYALDTYEVLWRCVFRDEATEALNAVVNPDGRDALADVVDAAKHSERFEDANEFFDNLFGDLWVARSFILVFGFGAPLVSR